MDEKTFTVEQMLEVLCSMQQAITPQDFKSSAGLDPEDFLDLPVSKAQALGIEEEFKNYMNSNENYTGKFN